MGDISELRGLIVIGTFLAVTLLLIGWMPYQFWVAGEQGRTIEVPDYFESSNLIHWNTTYVMNITGTWYDCHWGKSEFGHDMWFYAARENSWPESNLPIYSMKNEHGYPFLGIFWTGAHSQEWINNKGMSRGTVLSKTEIEEDWDSDKNLASYKLQCSHFYMMVDVAYNTSAYENVKDAWDSNDLHILFGIEWDQMGTSYDAWGLVSSVLFFRPIEGIPFQIMMLISISIWIASAYIAYILVLRAIGAVFGGGGA
jgi:hypothetical protein